MPAWASSFFTVAPGTGYRAWQTGVAPATDSAYKLQSPLPQHFPLTSTLGLGTNDHWGCPPRAPSPQWVCLSV